ncbi:MAG: hypothetical protein K8T90_22230, partial [Planctomycetes bacterium]|nr:hypothetical protein [Planctomycetota bacterium]
EIEERSDVSSGPSRGVAAWLGRRIRGPLGGLAEKDARLLLRDPAVRIMLIQQMGYAVVPLARALLNAGGRRGAGELSAAAASGGFEWMLAGVVFLPVVVSTSLAFNPLGTEGPGLQHVLLGPVPRRTIVLSKVITLVVLVGGVLAALCGVGTFVVAMFAGHLPVGAALGRAGLAAIEAPCAYAVFAAAGAVFGSYFPLRVGSRDRRALTQASGAGGGCLRSMAGFATILVAGALCVPVALCFHHPALARLADRDSIPWLALTVPLGAAYAACAVWAGAAIGGTALAAREESALEVLTKSYE